MEVIIFVAGTVVGFIGGALFYRKHNVRLEAALAEAQAKVESFNRK